MVPGIGILVIMSFLFLVVFFVCFVFIFGKGAKLWFYVFVCIQISLVVKILGTCESPTKSGRDIFGSEGKRDFSIDRTSCRKDLFSI